MVKKKTEKTTPCKTLTLEDLDKSGLEEEYLKILKITPCEPDKTLEITENLFEVQSYKIPYIDPWTGKDSGFYRVKLLQDPDSGPKKKKKGFTAGAGDRKKKKKVIKYYQVSGTQPKAYFPSVFNKKEWKEILGNTDEELYITEGEKKAASGCAYGLAVIGLGGVWSWKSKKLNIDFIDDLTKINWNGRTIYLTFDSDMRTNPSVMQALVALGNILYDKGASVEIVNLPSIGNNSKVGLDDYLVHEGVDAFLELTTQSLVNETELLELNEELSYINDVHRIYQFSTGKLISENTTIKIAYANRFMNIMDDKGQQKKVNSAQEWVQWGKRRTFKSLTYKPGQPVTTSDNECNTWTGWGTTPRKGNITPWAELLEYIFKSSPEHKRWFLQWLAYPIQNPGTKLATSVVLYSREQGTGKSFIGNIVGDIYGRNYSVVKQEDLHGAYNYWLVRKQFVMGEEITGHNSRRAADQLKTLITQEQVTVKAKFEPEYVIPDMVNYLLTSNHPDAVFLEQDDRRFFVHGIEDKAPDKVFKTLDHWRFHEDGPAALHHHLLKNIDCKGFNPVAKAPMTAMKRVMADTNLSELDIWCAELFEDPNLILQVDGIPLTRDLWEAKELVFMHDPTQSTRLRPAGMSKGLSRAGFSQVNKGRPLRTEHGLKRLWAVRNMDRWLKANTADIRAHYNEQFTQKRKRNF